MLTWSSSSIQEGYSFTYSVLRYNSRTILSTYPSHSCSLMSACHYLGLSIDIDCSRQPGTSIQRNASSPPAHYIAAFFLMLLNKLQLWNAFIWSTYSCFPPSTSPQTLCFRPDHREQFRLHCLVRGHFHMWTRHNGTSTICEEWMIQLYLLSHSCLWTMCVIRRLSAMPVPW